MKVPATRDTPRRLWRWLAVFCIGAMAIVAFLYLMSYGLILGPSNPLSGSPITEGNSTLSSKSPPISSSVSPPITTTASAPKWAIFDAVDKAFQSLPKGATVFTSPPPMDIDGPPQEVEMRVGMQSPEELAKTIAAPGKIEGHQVQISNRMKASLCCDSEGLKITPISPTIQAVSGIAPTIWRWSIKPLKAGFYPVSVELDADVKIDGENTTRLVDDFHGTINVTITPRQQVEHFAKDNWQWLWTALLVPLGGWWWKRKAKKDEIDVS